MVCGSNSPQNKNLEPQKNLGVLIRKSVYTKAFPIPTIKEPRTNGLVSKKNGQNDLFLVAKSNFIRGFVCPSVHPYVCRSVMRFFRNNEFN